MEQDYEVIDLREIFNIMRNNIILITVISLGFAIIGAGITHFLIPTKYESKASMIVNTRQDQNINVTNDQITSAKNLVSTYSIIVRSDTVLDQVIKTLNLDMTYEELEKSVSVLALDNTQVMEIVVEHENQIVATNIVTEILNIAPGILVKMVEAGSVKIVSEARANEDPVSPSMIINVAASLCIGLVIAAGTVILKGSLNNKFKSYEDITKHLDLIVLGVIPTVGEEAE